LHKRQLKKEQVNNKLKEFVDLLPQEFNMNELNNNEKYFYINDSFTIDSYNPKHMKKTM